MNTDCSSADEFLTDLLRCWSEIRREGMRAPGDVGASAGHHPRHDVGHASSSPAIDEYRMHGSGCRVHMADGREVDFDWDQDGAPTFDLYRVRKYLRSRGLDDKTSLSQIERCLEFRPDVVMKLRSGVPWFTVASTDVVDR